MTRAVVPLPERGNPAVSQERTSQVLSFRGQPDRGKLHADFLTGVSCAALRQPPDQCESRESGPVVPIYPPG
jgi:hypothetical protein